jgi:hypothetical protein
METLEALSWRSQAHNKALQVLVGLETLEDV